MILIKELIKDLENLKGDFTMKYRTIPVIYGENLTKSYITMYVFFVIATCLNLIINYDISLMIYYYVLSIPFFLFFIGFLWKFQNINHYQKLHNSLKFIITLGLFSIILHGY